MWMEAHWEIQVLAVLGTYFPQNVVNGSWTFSISIGVSKILQAKLLGILHGLHLCWEHR